MDRGELCREISLLPFRPFYHSESAFHQKIHFYEICRKYRFYFLGPEKRKTKVFWKIFTEFTLTITQNSHFDLKTVTIESYGQFRWSFDHKYAEFTVLFDFSSFS